MPHASKHHGKYHGWKVENIGKHASSPQSQPRVPGVGETREKLKASWGTKRNTREKQSEFMTWSTISRPSNKVYGGIKMHGQESKCR